jgi:hypothetical protein
MTDIDWLAGRGYTMIHVGWPATFTGAPINKTPTATSEREYRYVTQLIFA